MSGLRKLAGGALLAVTVALAAVAIRSGDDGGYRVKAELADAGGLLKGANVRVDGVPVGKVVELDVDDRDRVVAELKINDTSVAPIGRDARMAVQVDGIFGERYAELKPGNVNRPLPSGASIAKDRTSVSVRLDDVLDTADLPTREALALFLNEQGVALAGRGRDLGSMLQALPPTLDSTERLVGEFASDNRSLGRLVEQSDRVVGSIAQERPALGRLVASAGGTFETLASRRAQLGETVRRAPATLASARRALGSLEGASKPLIPAARGLRSTAPRLTKTLRLVPPFTRSARPTLSSLRRLSPLLDQLGRDGTPVVRRLEPLSRELVMFSGAADPFTDTLDRGTADLFGVMEGWARSTQARDQASHVFRFGASSSTDTFGVLTGTPAARRKAQPRGRPGTPAPKAPADQPPAPQGRQPSDALPRLPQVDTPKLPELPKLPGLPAPQPGPAPQGGGGAEPLLDYLLKP